MAGEPPGSKAGLLRQFARFLIRDWAWWAIPLVVLLLLAVLFILLFETPIAPFLYPA